jgi:hypothetical protein
MDSDECQNMHEHVLARVSDNSELMTESELIQFLRIPEITSSKNHHNVVEHLKRNRYLPRIHICNKALYPKKSVLEWIEKETSG